MKKTITWMESEYKVEKERMAESGPVYLLSYHKDGIKRWCTYARGTMQGFYQEAKKPAEKMFYIYS